MALVKASLTGLVGVSLCMANISGMVTDTGLAPIGGVLVKLEKGGQTATTGADGRFTLNTTAGVLHGVGRTTQGCLSASIAGSRITVTVTERAAVAVAAFNLAGRPVSVVRKTLNAGAHAIVLAQAGAGLCVYRIRAGSLEIVLEGNPVGGVSATKSGTRHDLSTNPMAKQAMGAAAINDVIAATKTGFLKYRAEARNSDTSGIVVEMIASAGTVADADGNVYEAVRIGNLVWTVDNLRTTKYNDGTAIPLVTDSAAWSALLTPGYCFYDNSTVPAEQQKWGALYNWHTLNTGKLAPKGWHVSTNSEWDSLVGYLMASGQSYGGSTASNRGAKALAAKTDWAPADAPPMADTGAIGFDPNKNNSSGFSAIPAGYRGIRFEKEGEFCCLWTASEDTGSTAWARMLSYRNGAQASLASPNVFGFSVRLVRDE